MEWGGEGLGLLLRVVVKMICLSVEKSTIFVSMYLEMNSPLFKEAQVKNANSGIDRIQASLCNIMNITEATNKKKWFPVFVLICGMLDLSGNVYKYLYFKGVGVM